MPVRYVHAGRGDCIELIDNLDKLAQVEIRQYRSAAVADANDGFDAIHRDRVDIRNHILAELQKPGQAGSSLLAQLRAAILNGAKAAVQDGTIARTPMGQDFSGYTRV